MCVYIYTRRFPSTRKRAIKIQRQCERVREKAREDWTVEFLYGCVAVMMMMMRFIRRGSMLWNFACLGFDLFSSVLAKTEREEDFFVAALAIYRAGRFRVLC